jgi:hypothetical protein
MTLKGSRLCGFENGKGANEPYREEAYISSGRNLEAAEECRQKRRDGRNAGEGEVEIDGPNQRGNPWKSFKDVEY